MPYRWVGLSLLFFSGLLAFFVRLAPAVAIPDLQRAFSLDAVELGLLTALYLWPFALMQPVAGMLVDAFGARRTVTVFLVIAGTGQVVFALAPSFSLALLGRALSGLGAATLYVGAAKIMAQWFRSSEFGTLTGAWTSVTNLGGLTAAGPLAASIALVGWRISLGTVGVAVLVTALLVHIFVRDTHGELKPPASAEIDGGTHGRGAAPTPSVWQGMLTVLQTPTTWLLGGYAVLLFGTMTMMQGLWAVPYLMDSYGHTQQQAANMLTLWAVGLIAGCTLWGFVAETIVPSRKAVVLVGAAVYGVLWAVLAIWPSGLPVGVPVAGDVLGRLLRVDLDPVLRATQGFRPTECRRDGHGDIESVLLGWRSGVPADQWLDPRSVSACGGTRSGDRLPDTLLVQPGLGGAQRRARGIQSGTSEDRPSPLSALAEGGAP
jgi:sugar phosphate permease